MVKSVHFKVDNGDMTLVELGSGRIVLIDIKIRAAADNEDDETPDVSNQLRDRLQKRGRDSDGRLYVDAFLLTHPDQDHISGLQNHFHLGAPSEWSKKDDKIVIREMWSSPIVFRRADRRKDRPLCADAVAWRDEARRRANLFKTQRCLSDGDRIVVLGEDINGKTSGLEPILVKSGGRFSRICGSLDTSFEALLLAPMLADNDKEDEELSKNNSSVVMRFKLAAGGNSDAARYLFGGDAEVGIWERLWRRYAKSDFATMSCLRRITAPGTAYPGRAGRISARPPKCRRMRALPSRRRKRVRPSYRAVALSKTTRTTRRACEQSASTLRSSSR